MHEIHALIDAELFTIGEKFYLPTLREQWKGTVSDQVLNGRISKVNSYIHLFIIKSKDCV